ncbi:MAG: hypothetical protein V1660_03210 [archaeon]
MKFLSFATNPLEISVATLTSLFFSFLFTKLNITALKLSSSYSRVYFFFALTFLLFFIINFIIFVIFFLKVGDIKKIFVSPKRILGVVILMMVFTYASSLMHQYSSVAFGEFALITWLFFSLSLFFLLLFAISFLALILAVMNVLFSRNI